MSHCLSVLGVLLLLNIPGWGINTEKKYQRPLSAFQLSVSGGLTQFFGELNEQDFKGLFSAEMGYHFHDQWKLSFNVAKGQIGGLDREQFHSVFECSFHQVDLLVKYDVMKKKTGHQDKPFHVGFLTGLGLMRFHSEAYDASTGELSRFTNSPNSARNPLFVRWGTPKGAKRGIKYTNERAIPIGVWLRMPLNRQVETGLECRFYFVRTDKLDATSGIHGRNPEESDSYSDTPNDKYSNVSFFLSYRFDKKPFSRKRQNSRKY